MDKSRGVLRIFVLADTHNRLPENVKEMAKDANEIWHLGDVCAETILDELRAIRQCVTRVRIRKCASPQARLRNRRKQRP